MARQKAVLYTRISTDGQLDGYGLDSQADDARTAARRFNFAPFNGVMAEVTARDVPVAERPLLAEALELISKGHAQVLLVPRIDRLGEGVTELEAIYAQVWRAGGRVFTPNGEVLPDDPDDPLATAIRQMMGVFSQLDRAMIKKRLRAGKRAKKALLAAHGRRAFVGGRVPYGWRAVGGELVADPTEQVVIRVARRLHAHHRTLDDIARHLNREGYHRPPKTKNGPQENLRWDRHSVWLLLRADRAAKEK